MTFLFDATSILAWWDILKIYTIYTQVWVKVKTIHFRTCHQTKTKSKPLCSFSWKIWHSPQTPFPESWFRDGKKYVPYRIHVWYIYIYLYISYNIKKNIYIYTHIWPILMVNPGKSANSSHGSVVKNGVSFVTSPKFPSQDPTQHPRGSHCRVWSVCAIKVES